MPTAPAILEDRKAVCKRLADLFKELDEAHDELRQCVLPEEQVRLRGRVAQVERWIETEIKKQAGRLTS